MDFIFNGNELKDGVYRLTNMLNGRVYYGSCKEFKKRWAKHSNKLKLGEHANCFLQSDYNKCGPDVFAFEILEIIEGTKNDRIHREQYYLDLYYDYGKQCYNLLKVAASTEGYVMGNETLRRARLSKAGKGRKHSEETKKAISAAQKGRVPSESCQAAALRAHFGSKHSDETKAKMSSAGKGRKLSEEHKSKIGTANKGKKKPPRTKEHQAKMTESIRAAWSRKKARRCQ